MSRTEQDGLSMKGVGEVVKLKAKVQKGRMFEISLIALGNMLVGKGETKRGERDIGADVPTIRTV